MLDRLASFVAAGVIEPANLRLRLLDQITGAQVAYSMARIGAKYAGNCLTLRRDSDNAEADFGFVNNWVDTASITTWLNGANGYIKTWYDQAGSNRNATQTDTTRQPLFVASADNGKPAARLDGSNDYLLLGALTCFDGAPGLTFDFVLKHGVQTQRIFIGKQNVFYASRWDTTYRCALWAGAGAGTRVNADVGTPASYDGTIYEYTMRYTGAQIQHFANKVQSGANTAQTGVVITNTNPIWLGGYALGDQFCVASDMQQFIGWARSITDLELAAL